MCTIKYSLTLLIEMALSGSQLVLPRFLGFFHIMAQTGTLKNQTNKTQSSHLSYWQKRSRKHASLLGTEIAAMLLLDHAEQQPEHPLTTNSLALCDWLLAPLQRGDPASPRMQHRKLPPLTHHTETWVKQTHSFSDNIGFSWLKGSPGVLTVLLWTLKKREWVESRAHMVYTKHYLLYSSICKTQMVPKCLRIRVDHIAAALCCLSAEETS